MLAAASRIAIIALIWPVAATMAQPATAEQDIMACVEKHAIALADSPEAADVVAEAALGEQPCEMFLRMLKYQRHWTPSLIPEVRAAAKARAIAAVIRHRAESARTAKRRQ